MAIRQRKNKTDDLIHHSDRNVQYCCHAYNKILPKQNIKISTTQTGDPLKNAVSETINKTIKEEFTDDRLMNFATIELAKKCIKIFIRFYNNQRPHRSINWLAKGLAKYGTLLSRAAKVSKSFGLTSIFELL